MAIRHLNDLHTLAAELGVAVEYTPPLTGRAGEYHHHTHRINLLPGMSPRKEAWVLAHELAHAIRGDTLTGVEAFDKRCERMADETAATMLIDIDDYEQAENLYGTDPGVLAYQLDVTPECVQVFQSMLHRIGDTVYLESQLGSYREKRAAG